MFERLLDRAMITWEIVTRSDLHIGGHSSSLPADVDLPVLRNSEDLPIIPGSSIKGVFRTELERLLRGSGFEVCMVPDACYSSKWKREHPERSTKHLDPCLVCQVFGSGGNASPVKIRDATTETTATVIRDSVAIDRKTRKAHGSSKFDLEAVPKGTIFSGEVTIDNCSLHESDLARLGALLTLVEFFNACAGTMGHGVSRGYGEVEVRITCIRMITAADYLSGSYCGKKYEVGTPDYDELAGKASEGWRRCLSRVKGQEYGDGSA
ncbi:MAG: CRISPR-associated RAMP protein Csx7 [Methanospirillum sp.]|nr:CRISPR-associated RAMP protein Csx7 [Methanospirillum sp.]